MEKDENKDYSLELLYTDMRVLMGGVGINNLEHPHESEIDFTLSNTPELMSPQVDEVLSTPPNWLLRWGTTLFFFIIFSILWVSWFVKYPDVVTAPLKILPNELPKSVVSQVEGRIEKLLIEDGAKVQKDQLLAYLKTPAKPEDVLELEEIINRLIENDENIEFIYNCQIPNYFNLGELQKTYQNFQEAFNRSKTARKSGNFNKKKNNIRSEINSLNNLKDNTYEQLISMELDLKMSMEEAESQKRLADKGYISTQEAKNAMSRYLNKKQAFDQAKSSVENNKITQNQKRFELLEIDKTIEEYNVNLLQNIYSLKSDIEAWKQRYIAISPIPGTVHFNPNLEEDQLIRGGEEMMVVSPVTQEFSGEMWVGQSNFGKIEIDQRVMVKFESYPFQEYGTVLGRINFIADMPKDSLTQIKVKFPDGLVTNSNNRLTYRYGMKANAEIITEDMRLIERFFYDIKKALKR